MSRRRATIQCALVLLSMPFAAQAVVTGAGNSTPIVDDEERKECLESVLACLPKQERAALNGLGKQKPRVAPQNDIDAEKDDTGYLGLTSRDGCVVVSDEIFEDAEGETEPDKWLKKRVFFHEATHVGQFAANDGFRSKIVRCYGGVFGGLNEIGQALEETLASYREVDAGVKTSKWLDENEPDSEADDHESWKGAAKAEAKYLADNLESLCDGIANMPEDEALDDMKEAFNKCAKAGKSTLDAYNNDAAQADQVAVPANAGGK